MHGSIVKRSGTQRYPDVPTSERRRSRAKRRKTAARFDSIPIFGCMVAHRSATRRTSLDIPMPKRGTWARECTAALLALGSGAAHELPSMIPLRMPRTAGFDDRIRELQMRTRTLKVAPTTCRFAASRRDNFARPRSPLASFATPVIRHPRLDCAHRVNVPMLHDDHIRDHQFRQGYRIKSAHLRR